MQHTAVPGDETLLRRYAGDWRSILEGTSIGLLQLMYPPLGAAPQLACASPRGRRAPAPRGPVGGAAAAVAPAVGRGGRGAVRVLRRSLRSDLPVHPADLGNGACPRRRRSRTSPA